MHYENKPGPQALLAGLGLEAHSLDLPRSDSGELGRSKSLAKGDRSVTVCGCGVFSTSALYRVRDPQEGGCAGSKCDYAGLGCGMWVTAGAAL